MGVSALDVKNMIFLLQKHDFGPNAETPNYNESCRICVQLWLHLTSKRIKLKRNLLKNSIQPVRRLQAKYVTNKKKTYTSGFFFFKTSVMKSSNM